MSDRSAPFLTAYTALYLVFLYAPLALLPLFSLNDSKFVTFPLGEFTTRWYADMVATAELRKALANSLLIVVPVAIASTIIGLMAALALVRTPIRFKGPILALLLAPMVVPTLVLGVSLLTLMRGVFGLDLSLWTIAAGHVLMALPYSTVLMIAQLEGLDESLEEASMDLGQGPLQTFWRITLPLITPAVLASLLLASIVSFDEFLLAFFLSGAEQTLPLYIWGTMRFPGKLPSTLALGSCLLVGSMLLVIVAELLRRRGMRAHRSAH